MRQFFKPDRRKIILFILLGLFSLGLTLVSINPQSNAPLPVRQPSFFNIFEDIVRLYFNLFGGLLWILFATLPFFALGFLGWVGLVVAVIYWYFVACFIIFSKEKFVARFKGTRVVKITKRVAILLSIIL